MPKLTRPLVSVNAPVTVGKLPLVMVTPFELLIVRLGKVALPVIVWAVPVVKESVPEPVATLPPLTSKSAEEPVKPEFDDSVSVPPVTVTSPWNVKVCEPNVALPPGENPAWNVTLGVEPVADKVPEPEYAPEKVTVPAVEFNVIVLVLVTPAILEAPEPLNVMVPAFVTAPRATLPVPDVDNVPP